MYKYILEIIRNNSVPYLRTILLDRFVILVLVITIASTQDFRDIDATIWATVLGVTAMNYIYKLYKLIQAREDLSSEKLVLEITDILIVDSAITMVLLYVISIIL